VPTRSINIRSPALQRVLASLCGIFLVSVSARAAEIWLAGTDPVVRRTSYKDEQPSDYMQLFEDNAAWAKAAANVNAFKTTTQFVVGATDAQLAKMFAGLKKRNISFAMETLMLPPGDKGCGKGIEGYLDPNGLRSVIERILRLGGDLRYIAMDEPLWFGHTSNQQNACHSSIESVAQEVVFRISVIKKLFPNVEIGDIEPIATAMQPNDWMEEINQWIQAYQKATGFPLRFFDADVTWAGPWQLQLKSLATHLNAAKILFGIIYDGDPTDPNGVTWTTHAEERFSRVENDPTMAPQRAILQTWTLQPSRMLPETEPGTMTYLVDRYTSRRVFLTLKHTNGRLFGRLSDSSGNPVSNGQVVLYAVDGRIASNRSVRTASGEVPATADKAIVGLRINTECDCTGPANVSIGAVNYRDSSAKVVLRNPLLINNADTEFSASAGETISRNSQPFAVAAHSHFTLEIPMGATDASTNSGYLALIFLDSNGKEVERDRLSFQPAERNIGTVTTDSGGTFFLQLPATGSSSSPSYHATFSGSRGYRLTSTVLQ
jgi:hypothetical protein